ncbi:MAG: hypothetical protein ACTS3F_03430 [Phycisphaerales bacterium]
MPRLRSSTPPAWLLAAIVAGAALACASNAPAQQRPSEQADEALESYLAQRDMLTLRIRLLESQLERADTADVRNDLARRLAEAYAEMVQRAESTEERARWTEQSRSLIDQAAGHESDELRLSLAQARFRSLEAAVRAWRLRIAPPKDIAGTDTPDAEEETDPRASTTIQRVEGELIELTAEMASVAARAADRSRMLERQRSRAGAGELIFLEEEIAVANRRRSLASYLAGWAAYHTAEIQAERQTAPAPNAPRPTTGGSAAQKAEDAQAHFAPLLGEDEGGVPGIDRLSDVLLAYEHVARAALGFALAESIRGIYAGERIDSALEWIDAIEQSGSVATDILDQLPTARVVILARAQRWDQLRDLLLDERTTLSPALARLVAIIALEAAPTSGTHRPTIEQIASIAIAALIEGEQLNQVLDLAAHYRLARRSDTDNSFIPLYASALQNFQAMRERLDALQHSDSAPTTDRQTADLALNTAQDMLDALASPDAGKHEPIRAQASLLLGIALYHATRADPVRLAAFAGTTDPLLSAAEAFEDAARRLPDREQAAYAQWMAIRSLDARLALHDNQPAARDANDGPGVSQRRTAAADEFIARFPNDDRASALRLQRAQRAGASSEQSLLELLAVPQTSSLYDQARRRAANLAFELHRAAPPEDKPWHAARFLELAEPVLASDLRAARDGDRDAANTAIAQARRMLEVLLTPAASGGVAPVALDSPERAQRIIDTLAGILEDPDIDSIDREALRVEILSRQAQLALASGDDAKAAEIADELSAMGGEPRARGARLFYLHFQRTWSALRSSPDASTDQRLGAAQRLVDHAEALAETLQSEGATLDSSALVTILFTRAQAAQDIGQLASDESALQLARQTLDTLIGAHPRDQKLLRARAQLATIQGDLEQALDDYRTLLPGFEPGTDEWFEVRTLLIETLASTDPPRAREVINQHAALYPSFGPPPWGARLRALHNQLNRDVNQSEEDRAP